MARLKSATYGVSGTIPAGGSVSLTQDRLLRDILPDQAFKVHMVTVGLRSTAEFGDRAVVALAKNIDPFQVWTLEQTRVTHGILLYCQWSKKQVTAIDEDQQWVIPFPVPYDFDKDDSLNLRVDAYNTGASGQQVYASVCIIYE